MMEMPGRKEYALSFTAGALLVPESVTVAGQWAQLGNWKEVEKKVLEENLLQKNTSATARRMFREIRKRMQPLTLAELNLLARPDFTEKPLLLLLAACKTYRFVLEFMQEAIMPKLQVFDDEFTATDYSRFIEAKAALYPQVEKLTPETREKIRTVLFRMLEQAGILAGKQVKKITRPQLSRELVEVVAQDNPAWLAVLLMPGEEINNLKNCA